ncbi:hypothetical protein DH2020_003746 [Rehmannia glutinosa]|uniref:NADH-ubiquinone reductase complex 1 MLRQ subunit n=1 Tax=Rehmannia glutinosa TaxID=99300 RepID=A0ABR0XMI3_REHGL
MSRWVKPEVYPLFASVGVVLGICSMQLVRNICTNPEVRVLKENRAAGVLDNFEEGKNIRSMDLGSTFVVDAPRSCQKSTVSFQIPTDKENLDFCK